ncbi:MAG: hypothetical protein ABH950_02285 [Candidatus Altiarchaeota archaeon]
MMDNSRSSTGPDNWRRLSDNKELLSLILEMKKLQEEACIRKLGVEKDLIRKWAYELKKEGWLEIIDEETGDQTYILAEGSWERLHSLKEDLVKSQMSKLEFKRKQIIEKSKKKKKKRSPWILRKGKKAIKEHRMDIVMIFAFIGCIYFGEKFYGDMDEINNFLYSVGCFIVGFVIYYRYEENIISNFFSFAKDQLKRNSRYYIIIFIMFTAIFYFGRLVAVEQYRTLNLLIGVGSLASLPLIYLTREKSLGEKIRFIGGIFLFFYALSLLLGFLSLTELILVGGERLRSLDIVAGIIFLIILRQMDYYFGLGGQTDFKYLLKKKKKVK